MKIISFLLTSLLILTACSRVKDLEKHADDQKEAIAQAYIQHIIKGEYAPIMQDMEPGLREKIQKETLVKITQVLTMGEPIEQELVGYHKSETKDQAPMYNLVYQYGFKDLWVSISIAFRTLENGRNEIVGLYVYKPTEKPLQEINQFTFKDKGYIHYLFLIACICIPIFIAYTLMACIQTKIKSMKWLWFLFILLGFFQFSLNWTSGAVNINFLSFQLFGSGFYASSIYSPWIFIFSLPIGSIVFWIKRKQLDSSSEILSPDLSEEDKETTAAD